MGSWFSQTTSWIKFSGTASWCFPFCWRHYIAPSLSRKNSLLLNMSQRSALYRKRICFAPEWWWSCLSNCWPWLYRCVCWVHLRVRYFSRVGVWLQSLALIILNSISRVGCYDRQSFANMLMRHDQFLQLTSFNTGNRGSTCLPIPSQPFRFLMSCKFAPHNSVAC